MRLKLQFNFPIFVMLGFFPSFIWDGGSKHLEIGPKLPTVENPWSNMQEVNIST